MAQTGSPLAAAMQWVARIMAAAVMMILPGLFGQWLDERFGVSVLALLGFAAGIALGMYYLIIQTQQADARRKAEQARASEATRAGEAARGAERSGATDDPAGSK